MTELTNERLLEHPSSKVLLLTSEKGINRLLSKIKFPSNWSACWIWDKAKTKRGYGSFGIGYQTFAAHRVTYRNFVGPIPKDKEINHLCKVTSCVNPLHLEAITHHANVLHGDAGKNMRDKTHCPNGHSYNEQNTNHNKTIKRRTCRVCNRDRMRAYRAAGLYNGRVYLKKGDYE